MRWTVAEATRKKLLFATLTVGLVFGFTEVGMQIARMAQPSAFRLDAGIADAYTMPADPYMLFSMTQGTFEMKGVSVRINSLGWRGPEPSVDKDAGTYRVMFFGDSTVFGDGVREELSFASLTGRVLTEQEHREIEVVNAAVPGYSSTQCRIVFSDHVDRFGADAVVLAPKWSDIIVRPWTDADLLRRFSSGGYQFDGWLRRGMRHSAAFSWLEARYEGSRGLPDDRMVAFFSVVNTEVDSLATGDCRVSVAQHRKNLRSMCKHATAQGMDVVLVLLHCDTGMFVWPETRLNGFRRNYEEAARDFDIPLVDVPRLFPDDPEALADLFIDGIHPTAEGHEIIAAEVVEAIRRSPRFVGTQGAP